MIIDRVSTVSFVPSEIVCPSMDSFGKLKFENHLWVRICLIDIALEHSTQKSVMQKTRAKVSRRKVTITARQPDG